MSWVHSTAHYKKSSIWTKYSGEIGLKIETLAFKKCIIYHTNLFNSLKNIIYKVEYGIIMTIFENVRKLPVVPNKQTHFNNKKHIYYCSHGYLPAAITTWGYHCKNASPPSRYRQDALHL